MLFLLVANGFDSSRSVLLFWIFFIFFSGPFYITFREFQASEVSIMGFI